MANRCDKMISVRMENRYVTALDKWLELHPYYTRSALIKQVLGVVLAGCDAAQLFELSRVNLDKRFSFEFQISYKS